MPQMTDELPGVKGALIGMLLGIPAALVAGGIVTFAVFQWL